MAFSLRNAAKTVSAHLGRRILRFNKHLWSNDPIAMAPTADRETFLALHREAAAKSFPEIDAFEAEMRVAIDRDFLASLALHTQVVIKKSPINWAHGRVLYSALASYLRRQPAQSPTDRVTILETGTARGFSSLCMAKALKDHDRAGAILTVDVVPHEAPIYWNCIDDLEGRKSRRDLLKPWRGLVDDFIVFLWGESRSVLPLLSPGRVNFAFIDAAHDYDTVMFEFGHVGPRQMAGDMIVFDDVTPSQFPGIVKAVDEICSRYGYLRHDITSSENRSYVIATKN
jgi:predicted O-methyltransferase YrrM